MVKSHLEMTDSTVFQEAAQTTLAQMVMDLPDSSVVDPQTAIAGYHRIIGARQYMKALMALSTQPKAPDVRDTFNLNHDLK